MPNDPAILGDPPKPKTPRKKRETYRTHAVNEPISSAIENAYSELADLASECNDAAGNFSNSSHPKAEAFSEAASTLENESQDDFPDSPAGIPDLLETKFTWHKRMPTDKRHGPSRTVRLENAVSALSAAVEAIREASQTLTDADDSTEADRENSPAGDGSAEDVDPVQKHDREEYAQALNDFADGLEATVGNVDGVEFPGMYG